jgi:hypothetical protein
MLQRLFLSENLYRLLPVRWPEIISFTCRQCSRAGPEIFASRIRIVIMLFKKRTQS